MVSLPAFLTWLNLVTDFFSTQSETLELLECSKISDWVQNLRHTTLHSHCTSSAMYFSRSQQISCMSLSLSWMPVGETCDFFAKLVELTSRTLHRLKKFNPKVWLPTLCVAWGATATLQGIVHNETGFYIARFFMGVSGKSWTSSLVSACD